MIYRYRVLNWDDNFETAQSRKVDRLNWVGVPNKQHGLGLTKILSQEDGAAIYGIWHLIVGACSQQNSPRAGWLTQDGSALGVPWDVDDMAEKWRRRPAEIARALDVLCSPKVRWMTTIEEVVDDSQRTPIDRSLQYSTEQDRTGRGGTGEDAPAPASPSREDNRRELRTRLARMRLASDDVALEEWVGLLNDDCRCGSLSAVFDCLQFFKTNSRRDGVSGRYAKDYERYIEAWRNYARLPPAEASA
jgi:hypothetical protein